MRTLVAMLAGLGAFLIASAALFHTLCALSWVFYGTYGVESEIARNVFVGLSAVFGIIASFSTIVELTEE